MKRIERRAEKARSAHAIKVPTAAAAVGVRVAIAAVECREAVVVFAEVAAVVGKNALASRVDTDGPTVFRRLVCPSKLTL